MFALIRLFAIAIVLLTVIYLALYFYFRIGARDRLETEWEADRPPLPRHTYVEIGLRAYVRRLHRGLIVGIYAVPLLVICGVIYVLNDA